jgi:hypothetical protein
MNDPGIEPAIRSSTVVQPAVHERAVLRVEMLVEPQARRRAREHAGERRLAHRQRVAPQVQFDQVEGVEEHVRVMVPVSDAIERRDPVVAARDCFWLVRLSQIPGPIADGEFSVPNANHNRIAQALGQMIEFCSLDGVASVP